MEMFARVYDVIGMACKYHKFWNPSFVHVHVHDASDLSETVTQNVKFLFHKKIVEKLWKEL